MALPTRVFVIADTALEAHKLAEVFVESRDFTVVSASTSVERPNSAAIDVFVIRSHETVSLPGGVPALWLDTQGHPVEDSNRTHAFLNHATPAQIRAAVQALAAGLRFEPKYSARDHHDDEVAFQEALTDRELEILDLVAEGLSNPEIARRLELSRNTVKFHLSSIMGKLGASSRTEAVTEGLRRGLIII